MSKIEPKDPPAPGSDGQCPQFTEWWREVAPRLLRSARLYLRWTDGPEDYEDIVQQIAILALRECSKAPWKDIDSFSNWAHARMRWLILDVGRKINRADTLREDSYILAHDKSADVQGSIEFQDFLAWLNKHLTRRESQVLERRISGYSTHQIASDLGVTEATVRSLLRFARKRVAHAMALAGGEQDERDRVDSGKL